MAHAGHSPGSPPDPDARPYADLDSTLEALLAAAERVRGAPGPPRSDEEVTAAIRDHTDLVGATTRLVQVVARARSNLVRQLVDERTMTVTDIAQRMGRSRQYVQRLRDRAGGRGDAGASDADEDGEDDGDHHRGEGRRAS